MDEEKYEVVEDETEEKTEEDPEKKPDANEVKQFGFQIDHSKTKALGHGVVEVIFTTGREDYHGEKINPDGIIVKEYHGTVLYGHDYEALPVGKALKVWKDKTINGWRARLQLAVNEYPFAKTVYDMILGGYLTDVSIGGLVKRWNDAGTIIEEMIMKEFSIVPIGANHDAQIVAASMHKSLDDIRTEYREAVQQHLADKVKQMPEEDINSSIKSLKTILAVLEGQASELSNEKAESPKVRRVKLVLLKQQAAQADRQVEGLIKTIKVKLKERN